MAAKTVRVDKGVDRKLVRGINLVADLVSITLGPAGRAVLVGRSHAPALLLRNGHAVSQELDLLDGERQMGVQAMRELAWRISNQVGDGTTTAIVIARAAVNAGRQAIAAGIAPATLQAAIDVHCRRVVSELESMTVPVRGDEQLVRVATQAANGDAVIGRLIADAHGQTGIDGVVEIREGHGTGDEVRFEPGLHFDRGWISSHFVEDQQRQCVEIENPLILLHLAPLNELSPIVPVLEMIAKVKRGLVIIAENVGGEALTALVVNKQRAGFKVAAVKAPGAGLWRQLMLDDIAIATGGMVIAEQFGTSLAHLRPQMAGRADKIRISATGTTLYGGRSDPAAVSLRVREIRKAIAREKHLSFDRQQHQKRLAWLAAGIGTIRIGGCTKSEIAERQGRAKAASAAVRAAQAGGVLPGGSSALVYAERQAKAALPNDLTGRLVGRIFAAALQAPLCAIANNAGDDSHAIIAKLVESDGALCYDATSRGFVPCTMLYEAFPVSRAAVVNGIHTASQLLGIGAVIAAQAA